MAHFSNAELAQKLSDLVAFWSTFNTQYKNWLGGSAGGGPGNDGKYPLTDFTGIESLVDCPAELADGVGGSATAAATSATAAAASATAAAQSDTDATAEAVVATAQAVLADADRIAAETAETGAVDAKTTAIAQAVVATAKAVLTAADAVTTAADVVITNADVVLTGLDVGYATEWAIAVEDTLISAAAGGNQSSDYSALHWAAKAATFDPLNFYLRTALDTGQLDNRYYTETEIDTSLALKAALAGATFTGAVIIDVDQGALLLTGNSPELSMIEDDATVDEGAWVLIASGDNLTFSTATDAAPLTAVESFMKITRTGTVVNLFQVKSDLFRVLSVLQVDGAMTAASYNGVTAANLLDKSAAETITANWIMDIAGGGPHLYIKGGSTGTDLVRFERDVGANTLVAISGSGGEPQIRFDRSNGTNIWYMGVDTGDKFVIGDGATVNSNDLLTLTAAGNLSATSFGGIASANLLDKTAAETISGIQTLTADEINFSPASAQFNMKFNATTSANDVDMQYRIGGTLTAIMRWDAGTNQFSWMDRDPSSVTQMVLDLESGSLAVTGAVTGSNLNIANWDTAYGWGNHASASYANLSGSLSQSFGINVLQLQNIEATAVTVAGQIGFDLNDGGAPAELGTFASTDPLGLYISDGVTATDRIWHTQHFTGTHVANWQTAYGWGDHASGGYAPLTAPNFITDIGIVDAGNILQNGAAGGLYFLNAAVSAGATDMRFLTTNDSGAAQLQLRLGGGDAQSSFFTGTLDVTGALNALSFGGITSANLVDKLATEVITGQWSFGISVQLMRRTGPSALSTAGSGWYRVAKATGSVGRGGFDIHMYTTGGSFVPQSLHIVGHKDWGTTGRFESIHSTSNQWWTGVRIVDDTANSDTYVEVNFSQAVSTVQIYLSDAGYLGRFVPLSGALTAHVVANTVRFTHDLTADANHFTNLDVSGATQLTGAVSMSDDLDVGTSTKASDTSLGIRTSTGGYLNTIFQIEGGTSLFGVSHEYNGATNVYAHRRHENSADGVVVWSHPRGSSIVTFTAAPKVNALGIPYHVSTGYVGGKITVASSAPGSPTKGDIWFDTT